MSAGSSFIHHNRVTRPDVAGVSPRWLSAAAAACAIVFALLTFDALMQPFAPFDPWILNTIQQVEAPMLEPVIRPVDWLTDGPGAVLMWFLVLAAFLLMRWWSSALIILTLPIGGVVNFLVGRYVVDRGRPDPADFARVIVDTNGPAYPSGHVMGAVMLYGFLFVLAERIPSRLLRRAARALCLAMIVISGFARIWYGAHWPSDVFGAYAVGGLLLIAMIALYQQFAARRAIRPDQEAGPTALCAVQDTRALPTGHERPVHR